MSEQLEVRNPCQSSVEKRDHGASADVEQQRAITEVQAAMAIAKRFPRDQIAACDRILQACARKGLAESALYTYARGGTEITGPSIRLAEAIAQCWGNIQFGLRELDQRDGTSTVEAFAWDVETNTRQTKTFQVSHDRFTKSNGRVRLTDPRDIYELVANNGARRLRACILGIIPGDVVEAAVDQVEATLRTAADVNPDRVKKMEAAFAAYGVDRAAIERRIQRRIDTITPAQMIQLGKVLNSIKDGMSSPGDWFDSVAKDRDVEPAGSAAALTAALSSTAEKQTTAHVEKPEPAQSEQKSEAKAESESKPKAHEEKKLTYRKAETGSRYQRVIKLAADLGHEALAQACRSIGCEVAEINADHPKLAVVEAKLNELKKQKEGDR